MLNRFLIFVGLLAAAKAQGAFQPTGKFDLGPADIKELCTLVEGAPPPDPPECVYFKWTTCPQGDKDPNKPCGWYQMDKCGGARRKKRDIGNGLSDFDAPEGVWGPDPHLDDLIDPESKGVPHISWPVRLR